MAKTLLVEANWQPMLYEPRSPGEYRRRLVGETRTVGTDAGQGTPKRPKK